MITLDEIKKSADFVWNNELCRNTALMKNCEGAFSETELPPNINLHLKMESAQNSGSFKIRGAVCQFDALRKRHPEGVSVVCYSGGNYGKAFSIVAEKMKIPATVVMPHHVPKDRSAILESHGAKVELGDQDDLVNIVHKHVEEDRMVALDPFDDLSLIQGYGSIALEIIEDIGEPDVVLVPVGGGGLLAGIASGLRLSGLTNEKTLIYGVEPATANVMWKSFEEGKPARLAGAKSVAVGACAPTAGQLTYPLCRQYVDGMLMVTDDEILDALRHIYKGTKVMVEPTGAVALAAVLHGKLPEACLMKQSNSGGKCLNIVVILSGSNIAVDEFLEYVDR